jgi:ethanolamine utilization cobalamin adenosyltransferase
MKFVTEMELRDSYGREPYAAYIIEKDTRLTPGARQFLIDRGVEIIDKCAQPIKATNTGAAVKPAIATPVSGRLASGHVPTSEEKAASAAAGKLPMKNWRFAKLHGTLIWAEAEFLRAEEELLASDIMLAQKVTELGKQFRAIRAAAENGGDVGALDIKSCAGMDAGEFKADLGDCFEITEFHAQLPNGRTIVSLFSLRAALRQIEPVVYEYCEGGGADEGRCSLILSRTSEIINVVTQLIHEAVGGRECLRKA